MARILAGPLTSAELSNQLERDFPRHSGTIKVLHSGFDWCQMLYGTTQYDGLGPIDMPIAWLRGLCAWARIRFPGTAKEAERRLVRGRR